MDNRFISQVLPENVRILKSVLGCGGDTLQSFVTPLCTHWELARVINKEISAEVGSAVLLLHCLTFTISQSIWVPTTQGSVLYLKHITAPVADFSEQS